MYLRFVAAVGVVLASTMPGAQTPVQPVVRATGAPAFEVASVKRNVSGDSRTYFLTPPTGIVTITNATLRTLVQRAYEIDPVLERFQLVVATMTPLVHADNDLADRSAPRFDVQGSVPEGSQPGDQYAMLRTLLADRFNLQAHRELRPVPVYALTVDREGRFGPRLQPSAANCAEFRRERSKNPDAQDPPGSDGRPLCTRTPPPAGMNTIRSAGPISHLVAQLQVALDRPLIDDTRLSGTFAWDLSFEGRINSFDAVASIPVFTAVREQLGLRIEARTAPYEVLVIDAVDMPTEN